MKGIATFDPSKGSRLATYAARCIENAILSPASLNRSIVYPKIPDARIGGFLTRFPPICISFATHKILM